VPPCWGPAGQHARRGESRGNEGSTAFSSFHSGEARAVRGTGRTAAELRARSGPSSPRPRSKKGLMMPHHSSLTGTDCIATLCPLIAQMPKPENILKTKGRKKVFSLPKPENIRKIKHLQEAAGTAKEPDKMTVKGVSPGQAAGGGKGLMWLDIWAS